jgi:hypothetical protein
MEVQAVNEGHRPIVLIVIPVTGATAKRIVRSNAYLMFSS